ncbi:hypothetical protein ColKHC_13487 [Colletotrichum higginsianum]|nr:hypothetical protein ColKHC_13487 [Colletotrichum higginsianum]
MGTVAMSLPPTVLLRASQDAVEGQQSSPGRQRHEASSARLGRSPAATNGAAAKVAVAMTAEVFILTGQKKERG